MSFKRTASQVDKISNKNNDLSNDLQPKSIRDKTHSYAAAVNSYEEHTNMFADSKIYGDSNSLPTHTIN